MPVLIQTLAKLFIYIRMEFRKIPTLGGLLLTTLQSSNTLVLNSFTNSSETGKKVAKIFREQKRELKTGSEWRKKIQTGKPSFLQLKIPGDPGYLS